MPGRSKHYAGGVRIPPALLLVSSFVIASGGILHPLPESKGRKAIYRRADIPTLGLIVVSRSRPYPAMEIEPRVEVSDYTAYPQARRWSSR